MSQIFLIQFEPSQNIQPQIRLPSEDAASVLARINEYNWMRPNDQKECWQATLAVLQSFSSEFLSACIPIGSIEFIERVLSLAHGIPHILPIGIPDEILSHPEWLGRKIVFTDSIQKAPLIFSHMKTDRLFMKSTGRVKTDFTGIYDRFTPLPTTSDPIMFSEEIQIKSEWRAFVFRQRLMDIRCYSGDPWLVPDKKTVMSMIDAIGQKYPAYTLDVAVTPKESGFQTVVIEVHNFISCGLYGAVLPLGMYASAYRFELQLWENRR